ncbi:MAG: hypothetical protein NTV51_25305 [Verrucomicrobia bacterium]|nr:hypothetical protein [Verrucomicrobiota bacterium]
MKWFRGFLTAVVLALGFAAGVGESRAATFKTEEEQVAEAIKGKGVTVVHFWAPWNTHSTAGLAKSGWSTFIDTNAETTFLFVTAWSNDDGRALLEKNGVGTQANFKLLLHPNASRKEGERFDRFLGLPVTWLPTTWIFRDGKLCYALNFGEVRFPLLQQLIRDAGETWEK